MTARPDTRAFAPALAVAAVAVSTWLAYGVGADELALYAGYELAFVLLPGWAVYRCLRSSPASVLEELAFGFGVGHVLEILAFVATAELGVRGLFAAYPLLFAPLVLLAVRRRRSGGRAVALTRGEAWGTAVVCGLAVGYLALALFSLAPLPWRAGAVAYHTDLPFHLSIVAEAKHHWPVEDSRVAGLPFPYHIWANLHMAAVSQVTGLELPLVVLRLFQLPLAVAFVLQLVVAAKRLTGRAWVGPVAAGLTLLVSEMDLEPGYSQPFSGYAAVVLWGSPSYLLGLVLFVPALVLVAERLNGSGGLRDRRGDWLLLALLLLGCAATKATILPVLGGGLCVYLGWRWIHSRRVDIDALASLGLTAAAFGVLYLLLYRASEGWGGSLSPGEGLRGMPGVMWLREHLAHGALASIVFWTVASVLGPLGTYGAGLAGLPWALGRRGRGLDPGRAFLLCLLVVGLVPYLLVSQLGNSQLFFSHYSFVAGSILSAWGLVGLAAAARPHTRELRRGLAAFAGAWLLALLLLCTIQLPWFGPLAAGASYAVGAAFVVPIGILLWWTRSLPLGEHRRLLAPSVAVVLVVSLAMWKAGVVGATGAAYLLLAAGLALLAVLALRLPRARRGFAWLLVCVAVAVAAALDIPLDHAPRSVLRPPDRAPLFVWQSEPQMASGLYRGLVWIREHTSRGAVLAVDNYHERLQYGRRPQYFYYSAFAERRVFLEGWLATPRAWKLGGEEVAVGRKMPFPRRLALNEAVFRRADRGALRTLARNHGVRYLVADRVRGGRVSPRLPRLARVVFSNDAVAVYAVDPSLTARTV